MKNTKKETVLNIRQVVTGLCLISMVVVVMAMVVGIASADSHLIREASSLAVFENIIFSLNYIGAKKKKKQRRTR